MPWGALGTTTSFARFTIFADSSADALIGTIWSSSPCRISVGTSILLSENYLMQS